MSTKPKPRPITPTPGNRITGAAVRAYRQRLGLLQYEFAELLGVTQGLVSQWESGRTDLGEESQRRLWARFDSGPYQPRLGVFLKEFERGVNDRTPLATDTRARATTLLVWKWNEQFDLGLSPGQTEPCGLVTVCIDDLGPAVALELPPASRHVRGDVVVFARVEGRRVSGLGLWLVQQRRGAGASQVLLVKANRGAGAVGLIGGRPRVVLPKSASFDPDAVESVFRAVYEGRYL